MQQRQRSRLARQKRLLGQQPIAPSFTRPNPNLSCHLLTPVSGRVYCLIDVVVGLYWCRYPSIAPAVSEKQYLKGNKY